MNRLREELNPEEVQGAIEGKTRYMTSRNRYRLHCAECYELFYVDEGTYRRATSPLQGDPSEIAFLCDACEQEYSEEEYLH